MPEIYVNDSEFREWYEGVQAHRDIVKGLRQEAKEAEQTDEAIRAELRKENNEAIDQSVKDFFHASKYGDFY